MSRNKWKAIISTILLVTVVGSMVTGLMMFFVQGGMILGIPRKYINDAHVIFSLIMFAALLFHFPLNAKLFRQEWRGKK